MVASGPISPRRLSVDAIAALESGDIDALLCAERREFGSVSVMMADPPDDDDDDDDDDDTDDGDDDANDDKRKKGKKSKESDDDDDDGADTDALRRRMKAADRRADAADKRLKEIEDAKKDDLQKATETVAELEKSIKDLQSEVSTLRLSNAFLTSNTQSWHDPDTALALASTKGYLEDVVDEESGEVDRKALGKALERLGKEHKYLVKPEKAAKDADADVPSGEAAGGRSDNLQDDKVKKANLKKRFPALNR